MDICNGLMKKTSLFVKKCRKNCLDLVTVMEEARGKRMRLLLTPADVE